MASSHALFRLGGVPEHFNLPWHLAMESPRLTDLDLVWEDQPGGTGEMLTKLEAGTLDIVSILTEGTVKAIAEGLDITIIQQYVSSPLLWGVFVPGSSTYENVADLAEARIAISRFNSGSHLMAYIQAERMGWELSDDQFVVVGNLQGAVNAFANGEADLFLWDQFMTRPLVSSGAFRQLGLQPTPWPSFVIAARNEVVAKHAAALEQIVDAVVAEAGALHDRPDRDDLVSTRYGLSSETVADWFSATSFASRSPMDQQVIDTVTGALIRVGTLPNPAS